MLCFADAGSLNVNIDGVFFVIPEHGFTTFAFDFAGWGESEAALRYAEIPLSKIANLRDAARFVASQSFVDPDRVAYLGICASAQYMLRALTEPGPIRAFASVAGWFHDSGSIAPFNGAPKASACG